MWRRSYKHKQIFCDRLDDSVKDLNAKYCLHFISSCKCLSHSEGNTKNGFQNIVEYQKLPRGGSLPSRFYAEKKSAWCKAEMKLNIQMELQDWNRSWSTDFVSTGGWRSQRVTPNTMLWIACIDFIWWVTKVHFQLRMTQMQSSVIP